MSCRRKKNLGKGSVTIVDDQISVDVFAYLTMVTGTKVALAIQDKVGKQILFMTDLAL